ncbi:MAG: vWA domain-containing protein [Armatimonadota bacterium]
MFLEVTMVEGIEYPQYAADITRRSPACFLFLIDQSSSMAQPFGDRNEHLPTLTKAEGVAQALNNLLRSLVLSASKSDGIRNYFEVGVIGYGETADFAWRGALAGSGLVAIRDVANNFLRVNRSAEDNSPQPVWIEPVAKGSTLMCDALDLVKQTLSRWVYQNNNCFPPIVVHITDGEATDGDPAPLLEEIGKLQTAHGKTLLFHVHLSSSRTAEPASFPDSPDGLPDAFARLLYEHSSPLTPFMRTIAWENGQMLTDKSRAFVLNADPSLMVLAMEIGTRPGKLW